MIEAKITAIDGGQAIVVLIASTLEIVSLLDATRLYLTKESFLLMSFTATKLLYQQPWRLLFRSFMLHFHLIAFRLDSSCFAGTSTAKYGSNCTTGNNG
jgi:hypothetical protein